MDFGELSNNIPVIMLAIGLILLQFFLRRQRKPELAHQDIARSLLGEVRLNRALAEVYHLRQKPKKFETVSWLRSKTKLDFLDQSLQLALTDAFTAVEDFNRQVEVAKKYRSSGYLASVNVDKLKEPLTRSQQGLEQWLLAKTGTKESTPKYPGIFDGWLGRG